MAKDLQRKVEDRTGLHDGKHGDWELELLEDATLFVVRHFTLLVTTYGNAFKSIDLKSL